MTGTIAKKFSVTATYLPERQSADTPVVGFCVEVYLEEPDAPYSYLVTLLLAPDGDVYCDARPTGPDRFDSSGVLVERAFLSLGQPTLDEIVSALMQELSTTTRTMEPVTLVEW
ncbi:hypothetical protein [Paraburkholderia fungorum]|jgi:hypothetical protein|uniref:hypothetical protein n=1 Tax=Paraburkholderia fungorum TaxID=134537 RepID=UPI000423FB0E|nr:hypothetical protein [Paraburkholderia fungorum]PZR48477.1 MAG: hypothetical protein DI523_10740 [Paraburkholderia fungorum]